jgi:rfaE bifunctional protein kinase chain/domain
MLTTEALEQILDRIPSLTVCVFGDLFLDRYLDLDAALTERSLETGLDAYQVVRVRSQPGAAGTIINNLVALGVGRVLLVTVIGDDGEGYELSRALRELGPVDTAGVALDARRRTPTYTKPMLQTRDHASRELNRLDIKNRKPLPPDLQERLLVALEKFWASADALVVLDQVSEPDCGVATARVRQCLEELGAKNPDRLILADSRERIGLFRNVTLKPNRQECLRGIGAGDSEELAPAVRKLAHQTGRAVFCTLGERGILVDDGRWPAGPMHVPAYRVSGPIDVVGAGDSTSAAIACALASGTSLPEAASFGNLIASITIQQLGTTGTASPDQVRRAWRERQSQRVTEKQI